MLEIIVRADAQSADQSVRHIIGTYKTWFQQESVLRVTTSGKATF
ncbi:MAG: DUF3574 domain-containing protein [Ignavibacteriales bacterium]|nr:DUF3574 domain-containing protein [Ignavibacteriales bacterium]